MGDKPTLEEQLEKTKNNDKIEYLVNVVRVIRGERTPELKNDLYNPPLFIRRDAEKLFEKIMEDEENGHPTTERYIRKLENLAAFAYLLFSNLVDVKEKASLGIFKRKVIVSKAGPMN